MASKTLSFDLKIYTQKSVTEAIEAFADFGQFTQREEDNAIVVEAEVNDDNVGPIWGEFQNYVLVNS